MWSQKLKSGNVCYYERYKDPLTGKTKTATITIKPTGRKSDAKVAEDALREKIHKIMSAGDPVNNDITFADLCEKYVEYQHKELKLQSAEATRRRVATLIRLIGRDTIAGRLSAPVVTDRLYTGDDITFNERLTRFKALMRWAYRAGYVDDVAYLDRIQRKRVPSTRVRDAEKYLEHEEIDKLLSGMKVERWKLLTEFLILSGLRIGEAIALNDSDVDLDAREISVTKTFSREIRQISTTKTEMSERSVYMQDELLDVCRRIKKSERERQLMYVYRTDLFMSDDYGKYISYDAYAKYFRENTERFLGRRLTPHSLRHTHTALLAEAGVSLDVISRRLGHANSGVTRDVYMHVTNKMRDRDRERLKSVKMLDIC